ncbi:MAG: hypothetical protein V3T17_14855 [Pseudomonadales bacterium]
MLEKIKKLIDDQRKILRLYALGALFFFIGVGFIQSADKLMEPSLQQESYALLGMFIGGLGFFTAMLAQIFLIIFRFRKMGKRG